ncbi:MAG: bifunctional oligoribonuclease/PAP phosphatase NrnA [Myxococcota bacterium]|nr:bifunctional oligoribonuclease/PAP phosphatase NrnA [Myxococcota bacterium]
MNEAMNDLHRALAQANTVLLTGPMDPDGDSIGACLALARAAETFSSATVHVAGELNYRYAWIPDAERVMTDDALADAYDLVVVMDGDRGRLTPRVTALFQSAESTALVDHHQSSSADGYDVVLLDPTSPSTCEMVYRILSAWGVALNSAIATHLYTGVIFDTGGFKHENTRAETHRLAAELLEHGVQPAPVHAKVLHERTTAGLRMLGEVLGSAVFYGDGAVVMGIMTREAMQRLGIQSGDAEGIVDALLNTAGVEVAVLAKEAGEAVKLSFRSKSRVNVAAIARDFAGGGGHVRAAGARFPGAIADLVAALPPILEQAVRTEA